MVLLVASTAVGGPPKGAPAAAVAPGTGRAARRLDIRPNPDADWGDAVLPDVKKVLYSAAETLWVHVPDRRLAPILVEPRGGPIVLYRRGPGGAYQVRLNTTNRRWAQYAFQFAHEFCHILCRYTAKEKANKWFEESVCETASLFALRRMAEVWRRRPPYPNWRSYAPHLREYAEDRLRRARLPAGTTLAEWYRAHADYLREHPCDRDKNLVVAGALLPLFEEAPDRWAAVEHLNDAAGPEPRPFVRYLADWRDHLPAGRPDHRAFVKRIADLFGLRLPTPK